MLDSDEGLAPEETEGERRAALQAALRSGAELAPAQLAYGQGLVAYCVAIEPRLQSWRSTWRDNRRQPHVVKRPAARRRGTGGRPAVKGAARRSSSRSGDGGSDDGEPEPARLCACGCGRNLAGKHAHAKVWGDACQKRLSRAARAASQDADGLAALDTDAGRLDLEAGGAIIARLAPEDIGRFADLGVRLEVCHAHGTVHRATDGCDWCLELHRALMAVAA